ncbi:MAG: asparagine synthase (glutamine-hydrolyzing) [bacterium]
MCGIAGIYAYNSAPPAKREIEQMTEVLAHRGPDGSGFFQEDAVAFGHRRLSIIDIDSGQQPMTSPTGQSIITYNGEIYNFPQLRQNLVAEGYPFKTRSDTEVILALYEKYGMSFLDYISGMFAFALWDRTKRKLILTRDRIGIKPLYHCDFEGKIYFASEIKAIRSVLPQLNELNPAAVNFYFTRQYVGGNCTIFNGIEKLPPASVMEIVRESKSEYRYWQPAPALQNGVTMSQAAIQLDGLFNEAVKGHLVSDVPVGVFLSGGVDSSCLLAFAAQNSQEPLNTFSVGFGQGSKFNEIDYARILAEKYQTHHHEINVTGTEALKHLPFIIEQLDEPIADYAILPTYLMSRFAAEKVKVVLSGEGADELFGGYKRYHLYALKDLLSRTFLSGMFTKINLPGPCLFHEPERKRLLPGCFIQDDQMDAEQKMRTDQAFFQDAGHLNSMLYTDLRNWLVDDLLMKVDKMGMLASLETRVPYLDQKVAEYVLTLSGNFKTGLKEKKRLLKEVAKPHIPIEIIRRPKHGFTVPVGEWLKGPLHAVFEDTVLENSKITQWVDVDFISALMQSHLKGKNVGLKLWSILIFSWWVEKHFS